ncbi:DUF2782 domain-containing protein [Frateuria aurantia]
MRKAALLIAFTGLLTGPAMVLAQAQSSSATGTSQFAAPPPPPGLNDPGVDATRPATAGSTKSSSSRSAVTVPQPEKGELTPATLTPTRMAGQTPVIRDPAHPNGAPADDQDGVQTTQQGENTVQEFRRGGQVYMVVITPRHGPPQTYYVHPRDAATNNGGSNVQPPMYTLFQWGKPQKPVDPNNPDATDDGN